MIAVAERRRFDPARDARRHVKLTDGERLLEVVAVRGLPTSGTPTVDAAVKVLDAAKPLPLDRFEELDTAWWIRLAKAGELRVVVPAG